MNNDVYLYETRTETVTGKVIGDGSGWSTEKPPPLTDEDFRKAWDACGSEWLSDDPDAEPLYLVVVRRNLNDNTEDIIDEVILKDD